MKLLEISIEDFMSIQNVSITFEDGIISVIGKNNDVMGATSNGSGKSALFDAIVWGLYGKTIRPVGSDDVIRRGRNKASVQLYFQKGESTYGIARTRGEKASLEVNVHENDGREPKDLSQGTPSLTQGKLDEIIGMDYKTFLSVATFDLDALRFARATDKEQKEILERLLNLDIYNIALEKTRKDLATSEKELAAVSVTKGYLEQTKAQLLKENDNNNIAWEKHEVELTTRKEQNSISEVAMKNNIYKTEESIATYTRLISEAQNSAVVVDNEKISQLKLQIAEGNNNIAGLELEINLLRATYSEYHIDQKLINNMEIAKSLLTKLDTELKVVQRTRKVKESQIEAIEKRLGQPCKECNRPITEAELGGVMENYAQDVITMLEQEAGIKSEYVNREIDYNNYHMAYTEEYQKQIDCMNDRKAIDFKISGYNNSIGATRGKINSLDAEIKREENRARQEIRDKIAEYQKCINQANYNISVYNNEIVKIKHVFELLEAKSSAYKSGAEVIFQKIVDNDSKLEQEQKKHAFISETIAYLKYWEKAFSYQGIRAVLLDDVAAKLTENANNYLKQMMGGSLWIDCHTQSTNKDGEKRERFEVQTFNSFGAGTYYGNSKGEQQRIDLALSFALHDIARTRSNSPVGFTIMDEIFERLDDAGCDSVIRMLHQERDNFGTVFVVSHNPNLTIRFPKTLEFVKQNGITSLVKKEHVSIDIQKEGANCEKSKPELSKTEATILPIPPEQPKKRSRGRPPKTVIS